MRKNSPILTASLLAITAGLTVVTTLQTVQIKKLQKALLTPAASSPTTTTADTTQNNTNTEPQDQGPNIAEMVHVDWLKEPIAVDTKNFLKTVGLSDDVIAGTQDYQVGPVLKVGTVSSGQYFDDAVYRITEVCEMVCTRATVIFDSKTGNIILPTAQFPMGDLSYNPLKNRIVGTDKIQFIDLATPAPERLELTNAPGYALVKADAYAAPDTATWKGEKIAKTTDGRDVYVTESTNCFTIILPDQQIVTYKYELPFYTDNRIPQITWNDQSVNAGDYSPRAYGGCGYTGCYDLVETSAIQGKIKQTGKLSNGEAVFEMINPNDAMRKGLYDQWYVPEGKKIAYEQFLSQHPIFFWKDPLGRWIKWTGSGYNGMAECGKPVIYLYPTKTIEASVQLDLKGEFTKTEPAYDGGWHVIAEPNGTLTNGMDGKQYPYLYWEGIGADYAALKQGFVVAQSDIEGFLDQKLAKLGLNQKEIADFKEFWVPRLTASPYALISFVPQKEWEAAVPLTVSPAPQTTIRVFMDWKPLNAPVSVEPQKLPATPARNGFTVVEWGGLLYK